MMIAGKYEATSAFVGLLTAQAEAHLSAVALGKLNPSARAKMLLFTIKLMFTHVPRRLLDFAPV